MKDKNKYAEDLFLLDKLLKFSEEDFKEDQISFKNIHNNQFYIICIFLWIKMNKTVKSICILAQNKLASDAQVLLRSLIESFINFKYISKKPDERTGLYLDYYAILVGKYIKVLENNKDLRDILNKIDIKVKERINVRFNEVKERYKNINLSKNWSGKSIEQMAIEMRLRNLYDLPYRISSEVIHGFDLWRHLEFRDSDNLHVSKGIIPNIVNDEEMLDETIKTTILIFFEFLKDIYKYLSDDNRLKQLDKEFPNIINKIRPDKI